MTNLGREQKQFEASLEHVIQNGFSQVYKYPSDITSKFTKIECVDGDEDYTPYPIIASSAKEPRDITVVCNVSAYNDVWAPVFESVEGITPIQSKRIYVGTALAWVGLVHSALDAQVDREDRRKTKNLAGIIRIQKSMQDAKTIRHIIDELECSEQIEACLYPLVVDDEEVQRINRLRYGLGVSYIINNLPEEKREALSHQFVNELSSYFQLLGTNLIDFALSFGLDKKLEPQDYKQRGISRAFHSLYFAGIQPMDITDIIGKKS